MDVLPARPGLRPDVEAFLRAGRDTGAMSVLLTWVRLGPGRMAAAGLSALAGQSHLSRHARPSPDLLTYGILLGLVAGVVTDAIVTAAGV